MNLLPVQEAQGDLLILVRTNARHFNQQGVMGADPNAPPPERSFAALLSQGLAGTVGRVNDIYQESQRLTTQAMVDPDSVKDINDVVISIRQATMALEVTKAVADRALSAYREIINLR
ncbi:MAG: flagellar hook-basal body complex protein FliE [Spirochaetales bacterium]|jgi:flagellar hook-basal body complex protein FliE|nr:flagellar hook-basal body complex protein FliE [Spirochaetales bacterium]